MIKVDYREPSEDAIWRKWREDCEKARLEAINAYRDTHSVTINNDLYKRMKQKMFDAFHGKCAFCETRILEMDQHGDVEHFRPKKAVTDEEDRPIPLAAGTNEVHPGYYWLAYDWLNLLPSCALCNQPNTTRDGRAVGKRNRFPVRGRRVIRPDEDLAQEEPILINPAQEDPARELDVELKTGVLFGKTPRGQLCIEILDLNRDGLKDARRQLYKNLKRLWNDLYTTANLSEEDMASNRADFLKHKRGQMAYTLVARKTIQELLAEQKRRNEEYELN